MPASVTELQRLGLFGALPGETLSLLAARMRREEIAPSGRLAGEERFAILVSGLARATAGQSPARSVLRPGELFGEVACELGLTRIASATALTACVVASCDRATFDELVRPGLDRALPQTAGEQRPS